MARSKFTAKSRPLARDSSVDEVAVRHTRKPRAWHVIHACEYARDVEGIVEAQIAAGMFPYVVTALGKSKKDAPDQASLMQAWQGVRTWRKQLDECAPPAWPIASAILHAHAFTAGMSAVRGKSPAVYDVRAFVEEQAAGAGQCSEASWLSRSFRTAEQFVLTRAAAVVVHGNSMRSRCLERGVDNQDIFVVPDPVPVLPSSGDICVQDANWLHRVFGFSEQGAVAVVARIDASPESGNQKNSRDSRELAPQSKHPSAELVTLLQAFAQAHSENEMAKLFVIAHSGDQQIRDLGHQFELDHAIFVIAPEDGIRALASADIVLDAAMDPGRDPRNSAALTALAHGRALLAPDVPANRDLTPEGRGCLWYKPADEKDLAHRLAFLARNRDFRKALGESGRKHILETRTPERIGQRYAEVYRHAYEGSKKRGDSQNLSATLLPSRACL